MRLAFVIGGARGVREEREQALLLGRPDFHVFTNHSGRDEPGPVDHWATFHPELMPRWLRQRAEAGRPEPGCLWRPDDERVGPPGITFWRTKDWKGSSGLLATKVALELGADRVILCGVPLDAKAAHYDRPTEQKWREASHYRQAWLDHESELKPKVRSMSGWTAELLGTPDAGWLAGDL